MRAVIQRKLERKKKNENLEATRQFLAGKHGKATGAIPSGVYDEDLDKEQNGLAAGASSRPGNVNKKPGCLADGTPKQKDKGCYRYIRGLCSKTGKDCVYSQDPKQCDPVRADVLAKYNPNNLAAAPVQRRLRKPTTRSTGSKPQSVKMCRFFVQGTCNKGGKCKFAHDERYKSQAKSNLDARKSRGRGRGRGGRSRGRNSRGRKARGVGAVDTEQGELADQEDEEEELDYIDVEVEATAQDSATPS